MPLALQHTETHCNTLQHTATHCNTLQHTATHCNTLQYTAAHLHSAEVADENAVGRCRVAENSTFGYAPQPSDHDNDRYVQEIMSEM